MTYTEASSPALLLLFVAALMWMLLDLDFRRLTPLQRWVAPLAILTLGVLNEALRSVQGIGVLRSVFLVTMQLPFFLLFLWLSGCGVVKMAFVVLSAMVFCAPPYMLVPLLQRALPLLPFRLCYAIAFLLMLLLVRLVFCQSFRYLIRYGENRRFLPFFPVGILYYAYIFAIWQVDLSSVPPVFGNIIRYLPTLQVFLFYFILPRSYQDLSEKRELAAAQTALSRELEAAAEQLALLDEAQNQSALYRHDMRHHLAAIRSLLADGDSRQAEEYIREVSSGIEAATPRRFCENRLVDLLCSSFAARAEQKGIRLTVMAALPGDVPLPDTELCAILSNGLENALAAVSPLEEDRRWVEFRCGIRAGKVLMRFCNPCREAPRFRNGLPVAGEEGHGYGCRSIYTIVQAHRGQCEFRVEDGVFVLRVLVPVEQREEAS